MKEEDKNEPIDQIDEDEVIDQDDVEFIQQSKEEHSNKLNDFALNVIKEARKITSTKVNDKFANDINGISGAQSGRGNDIVTSDRQLDPRISSIIEKMGIYRNMSAKEIENWKIEILKDPPSVLDGIKTYYNENVEPLLKDRENILKSEMEKRKGQNASVFLYVSNAGRDAEDGTFKENQKLMAIDLDKRPGFKIYHGQVVQQMRPDQTPFPTPEKLFEEDKTPKLKM